MSFCKAHSTHNSIKYPERNTIPNQQHGKDLQAKIDAAEAKNDTLSVKAYKAAQDQVNKGCDKLAEGQAKVDAKQQTTEAKADKNDAVKALGGLFK